MIIGKMGRVCGWILLICLLLSSCSGADSATLPLELLEEDAFVSQSEAPKRYCVTVPSDASAEMWDAAQGLARSVKERTGLDAECIYEHQKPSATQGTFFLYIGWIRSFAVSDRCMKDLKKDDYLCRVVDGGICLGGKSNEATQAAIDRFCREILPAATASALMHPDGGFSYVGQEYAVDSVKLNGFDLHTYTIVYPEDASAELRALAYELRDEIAERSGYWQDVRSEKEFELPGKGIRLGTEEPAHAGASAYLIPDETGLLLTAWDFFGISVAARHFCSQLLDSAQAEACLEVTEVQAVSYEQRAHRLASMTPEGVIPFASPSAVQLLTDRIQIDGPDAVFCGRMPADQSKYLTGSLDSYTPLEEASGSLAELTAYGKDGALSFVSAREIADTKLTVSSFWVGDRLNGCLILQISGTVSENEALTLSQLCDGLDEPTVILFHGRLESGTPTLTALDGERISAVSSEQYTVSGGSYFFACYATSDTVRVQIDQDASSDVYRLLTAERLSAF